ncbi:MAG: DUF362 domain-containing protein [Bacteroidales bacterium]|nr:DUF362 domain-containing protein [Bacteroidales bacterium]
MEKIDNKRNILTKREFLKRGILVFYGLTGLPLFLNYDFLETIDKSRVIVMRSKNATEDNEINGMVVQKILNESLKELTDQPTVKDAWLKIIPNLDEKDIIGIKINTGMGKAIPTQPKLIKAITSSLIALGLNSNHLIIYDMWGKNLIDAGYILNKSTEGVRCIGNDNKDWGYDQKNYVQAIDKKVALSKILLHCDHLINVPVLRVHMPPYGVTLSMKNHFGNLERPQEFHDDYFIRGCTALNNHPAIKEKQRINIIDCLYGFWGSVKTRFVRDFVYNGLIISKDPVAADYMGARILNEERARHDRPPQSVPLLDTAAEAGLGTNDPNKMKIKNLLL